MLSSRLKKAEEEAVSFEDSEYQELLTLYERLAVFLEKIGERD